MNVPATAADAVWMSFGIGTTNPIYLTEIKGYEIEVRHITVDECCWTYTVRSLMVPGHPVIEVGDAYEHLQMALDIAVFNTLDLASVTR